MAKPPLPDVTALCRGMLALRNKTGRDLIILGTAWIDSLMEVSLRETFTKRSGVVPSDRIFSRPLGTFESRMQIMNALGDLGAGEVADGLERLRIVRNTFAHTIADLDSDSHEVAALIDKMTLTFESAIYGFLKNPDEEDDASPGSFIFEGESFRVEDTWRLVLSHEAHVMFFLPREKGATRDDRLRAQIYACVLGVIAPALLSFTDDHAERALATVVPD